MQPDQERMRHLTQGLASKSAKMRALANTRYQFVRNVLLQDEARQAKTAAQRTAGGETKLAPAKLRLGPDGRIVIPAAFREALGLSDGDTLIASIDDGELNLLTRRAAVRRAQAIVRQFVPEGVSLVDELIEDRHREVEREQKNG
jgi:AbrB family looped-hinge helix DNA binding protein